MNNLDKLTEIVVIFVFGFVVGCTLSAIVTKSVLSKPVINIVDIDSLQSKNDSIMIKVEQLDSIKNAKIIEVSTLDNDSTLKLFYKLVKE